MVTSVSVILDSKNGSKPYFADAVGKVIPKPTASQLASPIDLLNPDRYEFYTFNDSGDLVKRLMTLDEIQGIVANGDSESIIPTLPEEKVEDVVSNVQNVLKEEIESHKTQEGKPILDTPDVSSTWSMILPAILGNTGENIQPNIPQASLTPDTIILEDSHTTDLVKTTETPSKSTSQVYYMHTPITKEVVKTENISYSEEDQDSSQEESLKEVSKEDYEYSQEDHEVNSVKPTSYSNSKLTTKIREPVSESSLISSFDSNVTVKNISKTSTKTTNSLLSSTSTTPMIITSTKAVERIKTTTNTNKQQFSKPESFKPPEQQYSKPYKPTTIKEEILEKSNQNNQKTTTSILPQKSTAFVTFVDEDVTTPFKELTSEESSTELLKTSASENLTPIIGTTVFKPFSEIFTEKLSSTIHSNPFVSVTENVKSTTENIGTTIYTDPNRTTDQVIGSIRPNSQENEVTALLDQLIQSTNIYEINEQLADKTTDFPKATNIINEILSTLPGDELRVNVEDNKTVIEDSKEAIEDSKEKTDDTKAAIDSKVAVDDSLAVYDSKEKIENSKATTTDSTTTEIKATTTEPKGAITESIYTTTDFKTTLADGTDKDLKAKIENSKPITDFKEKPTQESQFIFEESTLKNNDATINQNNELVEKIDDIVSKTKYNNSIPSSQSLNSDKDIQKLNDIILNSTSKLMSDVVSETATVASSLIDSEDETTSTDKFVDENSPLTDSVSSLISQIINAGVPETTGLENFGFAHEKTTADNKLSASVEDQEVISSVKRVDENVSALDYKNKLPVENIHVIIVRTTSRPNTTTNLTKDEIGSIVPLDYSNVTSDESSTLSHYATESPFEIKITNKVPAQSDTSLEEDLNSDPNKNGEAEDLFSSTIHDNLAGLTTQEFLQLLTTQHAQNIKSTEASILPELKEVDGTTSTVKQIETTNLILSTKAGSTYFNSERINFDTTTTKYETAKTENEVSTKRFDYPTSLDEITMEYTTFSTDKPIINEELTTPLIITSSPSGFTTQQSTIETVLPQVNEEKINSTWTLVSTVAPHSKIPSKPPQSNKPNINVDQPKPVELVPIPLQGFGLEDSTASLDADVYKFVELCNELAFGFWKSVTNGISSARSVFTSPFAATSLLAMVFLGARGATSGEMNEILKLDDMVTFNPHLIFRNVTESIEVSKEAGVATSAMVRELFSDKSKGKLLNFYKERARQFYDGHVEEASFKEIKDIVRRRTNLLVKRQTWGKIQEYVKESAINVRPPLAGVSASVFQVRDIYIYYYYIFLIFNLFLALRRIAQWLLLKEEMENSISSSFQQ